MIFKSNFHICDCVGSSKTGLCCSYSDEWLPVCLLEHGGFYFLPHFFIKPVFYALIGYFQIVSVASFL